jgi:uncharacterized protein (DUF2249 family)
MVQLDARHFAPRDRHMMILGTFDILRPGEAFVLVNDHAPAPLYYQFLHERTDQFDWEYLEEGPAIWRVRIGKKTFGVYSYGG